eukprot:GILI01056382.1.p2 GENE.GILI01056382.1~~GILI01056382.1.p2  ORF type:complete len:103 (+),score=1.18 GILI01056382.1:354-662(+)
MGVNKFLRITNETPAQATKKAGTAKAKNPPKNNIGEASRAIKPTGKWSPIYTFAFSKAVKPTKSEKKRAMINTTPLNAIIPPTKIRATEAKNTVIGPKALNT